VSEEFIGAGLAFPMRTDPTGHVALVSHYREIEESIRLILATAPGERPMRPDFGCAIHDHVFGPPTPDVLALMRGAVREALVRWEPRIELVDVLVTVDDAVWAPDRDDGAVSLLYIDIQYTVGDTNNPRNLVFPFYAIEDEQ
jgi:phage baseplate assembly protein W